MIFFTGGTLGYAGRASGVGLKASLSLEHDTLSVPATRSVANGNIPFWRSFFRFIVQFVFSFILQLSYYSPQR